LRFAISAGEKSRVPFGIPGFVAIRFPNFAFIRKIRKKITIHKVCESERNARTLAITQ
jgi:hypothetical protein